MDWRVEAWAQRAIQFVIKSGGYLAALCFWAPQLGKAHAEMAHSSSVPRGCQTVKL